VLSRRERRKNGRGKKERKIQENAKGERRSEVDPLGEIQGLRSLFLFFSFSLSPRYQVFLETTN